MKKFFLFACGFVATAMAIAACTELTGPKSPETPVNVIATLLSGNAVRVSWAPSPQSDGVVSYNIMRNGTKVGESTTTTYTDTGLAEKAIYKYTVSANCTSGVLSEPSAETTAGTVTTADITAPQLTAVSPLNLATGVSTAGTARVTFSEPMDPATINTTTFNLKVTATGALIPGNVVYNATARTAEFLPTGSPGLPNATNITVTVTTGAKDLAGNGLASNFTSTFTTRDEVPPTVSSPTPANGATGVSAATPNISVTFSEPMDATTINLTNITLRLSSSGAFVAGAVFYNPTTRVATFTPNILLGSAVNYTVTVSTGVKDAAGNALANNFQFTFTTADTTPPTVVPTSTVPANLATGVATTVKPSATFSEAMDPTTINASTFTVRATVSGVAVTGIVAYSAATNTATFTPSAPLASGTGYTATITTGAKDLSGNALAANFGWTFSIADVVPPIVSSVSPANGATAVPVNTAVNITFSEAMDATTINGTTVTLKNTATSAAVAGIVTFNSSTNVATFAPAAPLAFSTGYTVTVTTGVKDVAGNPMASQFTSTFTTTAPPDTTPPTVVSVLPANGATGVSTGSTVNIVFSEAMNATTINTTTVTLRNNATSALVTGSVNYNPGTNTATFTPASALANSTGYTVTVTTGVKDVAGNAMASPFTSTFTTAAPPDTTSPAVTSTAPVNGATGVAKTTTVTATFSEAMDPTTITASTFTLKTTIGSTSVAGSVAYDPATKTATFTPTSPLATNTGYTFTITTGVKDLAGNPLAANKVITFTTIADTTSPTILSTSPTNSATAVPITSVVTVTFSEAMNAGTVTAAGTFTLMKVTAPSGAVAGLVTLNSSGTVATFTPSAPLLPATDYTATVTTAAKDLAGNSLSLGSLTFSFKTAP